MASLTGMLIEFHCPKCGRKGGGAITEMRDDCGEPLAFKLCVQTGGFSRLAEGRSREETVVYCVDCNLHFDLSDGVGCDMSAELRRGTSKEPRDLIQITAPERP